MNRAGQLSLYLCHIDNNMKIMENMEIVFPRLFFTGNRLLGERVENVSRTLGDLRGILPMSMLFSYAAEYTGL